MYNARTSARPRRRFAQAVMTGVAVLSLTVACTADSSTAVSAAGNTVAGTAGGTADGSATSAVASAADLAGTELFDSSVVHSISLDYDETAYQAMIASYVASGDKEWISATVTIDGTVFENVGIKLKGNSTLQGLRGNNRGGNTGGAGSDAASTDATTTGGAAGGDATTAEAPSTAEVAATTAAATDSTEAATDTAAGPGGGGPGFGGGNGGDISADEPEGLPWRIKLDKYVEGQNYQGQSDIVVRGGNTETSLNEAVALELIGAAGLSTQEAISSRFSVNGSETTLRMVIQNPNDEWYEENFSNAGVLYKAEAGGDYSYRGEDAASYVEAFEVEAQTESGDDDYAPLIAFLKFINESDDATFAAELGNYLDVESFATYLAMQDLVQNSDDIDGPGNNSYLQYDSVTKKFTVVSWDQNLSFGGMGGGGMGGGQRPGGGTRPTDGTFPTDRVMPSGMALPTDGAMPTDGFRPPTDGGQGGGFGGGGGGGMSGNNILVKRFEANTEFKAAYDQAVTDLTAKLYTSGEAQAILDTWSTMLESQASDLVPSATIESEATKISDIINAS